MYVNVQVDTGKSFEHVFSAQSPITVSEIQERLRLETGLPQNDFYITHNGRIMCETDVLYGGRATIVPRLLGGKGGFGSMLRAIGAQIEKTTNREACRDLSGRRLRDINEEKRLKAWIEKQSSREEEAAERKKRRLEKLCAEPKYEFKDQNYERERSILTERIGNAVEEGFKATTAECSGVKRKVEENFKPNKRKTILDLDIDSDELDSSDASEDEDNVPIKKKVEVEVSNDSGHSSDECNKLSNNADDREAKESEQSSKEKEREDSVSCTSISSEQSKDVVSESVSSTPDLPNTSAADQTCDSTECTPDHSDRNPTEAEDSGSCMSTSNEQSKDIVSETVNSTPDLPNISAADQACDSTEATPDQSDKNSTESEDSSTCTSINNEQSKNIVSESIDSAPDLPNISAADQPCDSTEETPDHSDKDSAELEDASVRSSVSA